MFSVTLIVSTSSTAVHVCLPILALILCSPVMLMPYHRGKGTFQMWHDRLSLIYSLLRTPGTGVGLRSKENRGQNGCHGPTHAGVLVTHNIPEECSQVPENAGPRTRPVWAAKPRNGNRWFGEGLKRESSHPAIPTHRHLPRPLGSTIAQALATSPAERAGQLKLML